MTTYFKSVLREIPTAELKPCPWCGNEKPELIKAVRDDGHESWSVMCPVCGKHTCHWESSDIAAAEDSAVREWNRGINSFWMCRHCHATNIGLYYKFCPYCGEKRNEDIG